MLEATSLLDEADEVILAYAMDLLADLDVAQAAKQALDW